MSSGLYEVATVSEVATGSEVCALQSEIRRLYLRAGRPSLRQITKRAGPGVISHNTVSLVLKGQRVPSLAHALAVARALGGDGARMRALWEAAAAAEWGPAPRIEALPDRLFCIAHDRAGQQLCPRARLEDALAAAVIAELLLEGHVTLLIEGDTVAGFAVAAVPEERLERFGVEHLDRVLDRGGSWRDVLADWSAGLSGGLVPEVTHRLARSGVIQPGPRLRPVGAGFTTPAGQLRALLLGWTGQRPDLRTCVLAALVGRLGVWLPGPGDPRVVNTRMRAALELLPSPLREVVAGAGPSGTGVRGDVAR